MSNSMTVENLLQRCLPEFSQRPTAGGHVGTFASTPQRRMDPTPGRGKKDPISALGDVLAVCHLVP